MSSAKKFQIFISSTYTDLVVEREAVMKAILTNYHIPIGMEMFSAGDAEQWETIKETIDTSDYYVLIIGQRYGSQTGNVSYTQKEFAYALERRIPILAFIRDRNYRTAPNERDDDLEAARKLEEFIDLVTTGRMVEWFSSTEELALRVTSAIFKAIARSPRPGWIRSTEVPNMQEILDQMTMLQKENRELAAQLREQAPQRKPKFSFVFNGDNEIKLTSNAKNWPMTAFIKTANPFDTGHFFKQEEYTKQIHFHREKATKFNELKLGYLVCNNYKRLTLTVENVGNVKATDINLILDFPENTNLLVGSTERFPAFSPENKISEIAHLKPMMSRSDSSISSLKQGLPSVDVPRNYEVRQVGRRVHINIPHLLHTKNIQIEKIFMSGNDFSWEGKINISVVCEEMAEVEAFEIPITVEYQHDPVVIDVDESY